ncbi:MAG: copper resistance protein CopC [Nocardioides sp.]|uniref:copper resistance protein CopC n=1 Tax=Nocardioides sp. TaxID=35761 RepID=UPI0039E3DA8F
MCGGRTRDQQDGAGGRGSQAGAQGKTLLRIHTLQVCEETRLVPGNHLTFPTDLAGVRCEQIREALSAAHDGESPPLDRRTMTRHLAECRECAAFAASLPGLSALLDTALEAAPPTPDLAAQVVRRPVEHRLVRRPRAEPVLRGAVALAGLGELVTTVCLFVHAGHHEDHAASEATALTVGLCVALLYAALRPRLSPGYLPVLGSATLLMVLASTHDIADGEISLHHELAHIGLVVGFVLLCLLALTQPPDPGAFRLGPRRRGAARSRPRLRVVHRTAHGMAHGMAHGLAHATRRIASGARGAIRTRRHLPVRVVAGTLLAAVLILIGGPAGAHAVLESSSPAPDAVLHAAPSQVLLRFDEPVGLLSTSLQVIGPDGSEVQQGEAAHQGDATDTVAVPVEATATGTYLVSYRVISADSHPVSGAYTFSVGKAGVVPAASPESGDRLVGIALGVARGLGYAGAALLLGGLVFLAWCRPGRRPTSVHRLLLAGAALLSVGAAAAFGLKGPDDAAVGISHTVDTDLWREVIGTTYGVATLVRLALGLLALVLLVRLRPDPPSRGSITATAGLLVAVPLTFAFAGHANAGHPRWLTLASTWAHVTAMSVWLGGLVALFALLRDRSDGVLPAARRYSALGLAAVTTLVVTGIYQAWDQVRSWGALQHTDYGRELLVKVILVVAVLTVAASSRAAVWRRPDPARLRRTVAVEAVGLAAVIGVTSALVATQPAASAYRPTVHRELTVMGDRVAITAEPTADRTVDLSVQVTDGGAPTTPKQLSLALYRGGLGPLAVKLTRAGTGSYGGTVAVPVAGEWTLRVSLRTTAVDEGIAEVGLPIE